MLAYLFRSKKRRENKERSEKERSSKEFLRQKKLLEANINQKFQFEKMR